jgi:chromosomal replication initiation ATPase DnaA
MSKQIQFNFVQKASYKHEDYIVSSSNIDAFNLINSWPNWQLPLKTVYLYGGHLCGKSHLASILEHKSNALYLRYADNMIAQLEHGDTFIIEDLELFTNKEEELLHVLNIISQSDKFLLLTSLHPPSYFKFNLCDLQSRLNAVFSIAIKEPDDELLQAMLIKLFAQRQLRIHLSVIKYIVTHAKRDIFTLNQLVAVLDQQSLALKKPISIPMVKQVILDKFS